MAVKPIKPISNYFPYRNCFLFVIVLQYIFENYLNWRQMIRLGKNSKLPKELEALKISDEEYTKSKAYSKAKLQFSIIHETYSTILQIIRVCIYFGPWIWDFSGKILSSYGYDANNEYARASVLIILESLVDKALDLPFEIYQTFVLEEKFGFNKNTPLLFIKDEIISLILKALLIPAALCVFLWAVEKGGDYFYIYAEIVVIVLAFLMMWIYPNFIAPLFNKFSELPDGTLKDGLYKLADQVGFPLKKLFVCDGSRRSAHSNAYMYGFGSNKRIVLFDTLMNHLEEKEIEAVLCHEMGHWKKAHTKKQMIISFAQIFALFYVYGFFRSEEGVFLSFGYHEESIYIGLSLFLMIFTPLQFMFKMVSLKMTRRYEFQADAYAHELGFGALLKHGLIKIHKENLANLDPDPLFASFNYTHPTLLERLSYLNELARKAK